MNSSNTFQNSEFAQMIGRDISLVNRFNVPLHSIEAEKRVSMEQDVLSSAGNVAASARSSNRDPPGPNEQFLSAFHKPHGNDNQSTFNMTFEIPPLPSIPQSYLLDPSDSKRGEKLVTKTFFSFGRNEADDSAPGFLSIKERKVASFFRGPDGQFEQAEKPPAAIPQQNLQSGMDKKRSTKQAHKTLQKINEKKEALEKQRKKLLVNLFPYVDESKIKGNVEEESGIMRLWEDEHLDYKMNKLMVNEAALVTP